MCCATRVKRFYLILVPCSVTERKSVFMKANRALAFLLMLCVLITSFMINSPTASALPVYPVVTLKNINNTTVGSTVTVSGTSSTPCYRMSAKYEYNGTTKWLGEYTPIVTRKLLRLIGLVWKKVGNRLNQQNGNGCEIDKGEKRGIELVITRGKSAKPFDFLEETLDQMALLV